MTARRENDGNPGAKRRLQAVRTSNEHPETNPLHVQWASSRTLPRYLGHSQGQEKALTYQFGGHSEKGLPPGGQWRCLFLSKVRNIRLRDGPWHAGDSHNQPQDCVEIIDLDVNPASPHKPRRRLKGGLTHRRALILFAAERAREFPQSLPLAANRGRCTSSARRECRNPDGQPFPSFPRKRESRAAMVLADPRTPTSPRR